MLFGASSTFLVALAALTATTLATIPGANPSLEQRDSAMCRYFQDTDGLRYEIEIDSAQDVHVRWGCKAQGSLKIISFSLLGCNPGDVERAIYLATAPHLEGVKCITRG
ncbi:unnamed protein product [Clonostachys rosea f. rosea IK726]|uniref:Uncharacterized protein n=1 Tax=Clonostachys rosea f. rosea IK726 TaxID=1349383 RepID=A0ACA9UHH6_BIOOC|nr:unnamed protein product [Clonostachys rosea f. rosea IK726]